ncbi:MAG: peptide deformylase [Candidatus Carsonella ruddii]
MILKILNIKDIKLRIKNKKFKKYNKIKIFFLIKRMIITMYNNSGIGISSIQVNIFNKIILIGVKNTKPIILFNSKIIKYNKLYTLSTEGCLSIKNFFINIARVEKILIKYINLFNIKKKKILNNIISRCYQHENDHLNKILIIDYINKIIKYE